MKNIIHNILTGTLCVTLCACSSPASQESASITKTISDSSTPEITEETESTFIEKISGTWKHQLDEDRSVLLYIQGDNGLVLAEMMETDPSSSYLTYWYTLELKPKSPGLLTNTDITSMTFDRNLFYPSEEENSYYDYSWILSEITLTDKGIQLTYYNYGQKTIDYNFTRIDDSEWFYYTPEAIRSNLKYTDINDEYIGTWTHDEEDMCMALNLYEDGSFLYLYKKTNIPVFFIKGYWGSHDSYIYLSGESIQTEKEIQNYSLLFNLSDSTYTFMDTGENQILAEQGVFYSVFPAEIYTIRDTYYPSSVPLMGEVQNYCGAYRDQNGNTVTYSYILPYLTDSSDGEMAVNQMLSDDWYATFLTEKERIEAGNNIEFRMIDYEASIYNDIISIMVTGMKDNSDPVITTYLYNWVSGEKINKDQLVSILGNDEESFVNICKSAVSEDYAWTHMDLDQEETEQGSEAAVNSLAYDNIQVYVDDNGMVLITAPVLWDGAYHTRVLHTSIQYGG